jgi:hypothetical protein
MPSDEDDDDQHGHGHAPHHAAPDAGGDKNLLSKSLKQAKGGVTNIARGVQAGVKEVGKNVTTGVTTGVKGVTTGVTTVGKGVTSTLTEVGKGVKEVGKVTGVGLVVTTVGKGGANIVKEVGKGGVGLVSTVGGTAISAVKTSGKQVRKGSTLIFRSMSRSDSDSEGSDDDDFEEEEDSHADPAAAAARRRRQRRSRSRKKGDAGKASSRPSYRSRGGRESDRDPEASEADDDPEDGDESTSIFSGNYAGLPSSLLKQRHIQESAGTHRLQRILKESGVALPSGGAGGASDADAGRGDRTKDPYSDPLGWMMEETGHHGPSQKALQKVERVPDAKNATHVAKFCSRVVLPPFRVDLMSLGGEHVLERGYPSDAMQQEVLTCMRIREFEVTGHEHVALSSLQFPGEYAKHKRSLGLFLGSGPALTAGQPPAAAPSGGRSRKLSYVILARSTTLPLLDPPVRKKSRKSADGGGGGGGARQSRRGDEADRGDYDTMFGADDLEMSMSLDTEEASSGGGGAAATGGSGKDRAAATAGAGPTPLKPSGSVDVDDPLPAQGGGGGGGEEASHSGDDTSDDEPHPDEHLPEVASFPVLVCMLLNADGTAPDIRKLIPLSSLTTIQDLHATVVQLAFDNGDTVRLDFGPNSIAGLHKERFVWSLLQIHAVLCLSVMERSTHANAAARTLLAPVHVRNLDRAELQYVATVNKFLPKSPILCALLDRQRAIMFETATEPDGEPGKISAAGAAEGETKDISTNKVIEERDNLAYDLIMGNISLRVTLYSEEERKDAEEILNSIQLGDADAESGGVAERLGLMLHMRMRDLEAETCRRLIAWEDEKHFSARQAKLFTSSDDRDTVDALALASLFKTLESLDTELQSMEVWLQERAAAIKPLTDDCADIEEENRQLEQQWKSYDMLQTEMKRLLFGMDIEDSVLRTLRNPASALVYDEDGRVDVDESEVGVDQIYQAGRVLQEAMEFPRLSGGLHLDAVGERADSLSSVATSFCTALAHIIVTVMEQFNEEVLAGSDHGKVSKNDTHAMIAKKIRDTQRKFQSALLGYIKLIEILAALSPDMLPALRDAYSEMVAESILMKKRMKGYFQALPGKNAAYMSKAGKDLKDYVAFSDDEVLELVNAPDMKAALSELLPVIAREAYFTSALFGAASKEQDGREKKRNLESTRKAVDNASQHFRYYIERTCGILPDAIGGKSTIENGVKGDPLLCLAGSIYLNEAMDNYVDREKKGGDHSLSLAYVRATILDLRKKADKQWVGWVDKQIEWIRSHDGVPLTGKRAGVFPSFARFPCYLDHLILACSEGREEGYVPDILHIKVINYYLQKLAATLLESLKECSARESTDQQYASNVMQMENTYYFTQAIKQRHEVFSELFAKQMTRANALCKDSTDSYLGWMIKREFASLHELFSKVSKLRKEVGDKQVPAQVPKAQFIRTLQKETNRDVMKDKIGTMYSRMEKHLSEESNLVAIAWKALVKVLYEWFGRWEKMCTQIYSHTLSPSAVEIVRIAKAAGGDNKPKQSSSSDFAFKSILALGNKPSP